MKYVLLILCVLGITVSALALREHYREYGDSPCSINERWDCGVVNHSPYALLGGVFEEMHLPHIPLISAMPVATAGILGYLVMAVIAFRRAYRWLLLLAVGSLVRLLRHLAGAHFNHDACYPRHSSRASDPKTPRGLNRN